ncbi:hypothetical protein CYMTET_4335 [Cymbomonas tetramitiformis]|uniref:Uncharacterized protein n=1 Tax=Cymbomonas tetramitiformis TaxID=36881 RepID=A0AAE0H1K2_9CHLO|nr:hypothetical protein CYMTET_4335 [Cymbomonas tetramitiformis]
MNTLSMNATFKPLGLSKPLSTRRVSPKASRQAPKQPARQTSVVVAAASESDSIKSKAVAALVAGALLLSSVAPDAAEAARSAGRAGGRSFSSRSAPARSAPQATTTINRTTVVTAPSVYASPFGFSPFGFSPFGYGGFGFGVPIFGFGSGIISLMLGLFMVQFLFSVVAGFLGNRDEDEAPIKRDKRNDFDDL